MPELDVKYSGPVSPKRRRHSRSSSRSPDRGLKNHRYEHEDEHKSRYTIKERNKNRFRFGNSRSRSRSRERDRINWTDQRDREHGAGSRSDYYEKRDDAQRQRQDAFIARLDACSLHLRKSFFFVVIYKVCGISVFSVKASAGTWENWWSGMSWGLGIFSKSQRTWVSTTYILTVCTVKYLCYEA